MRVKGGIKTRRHHKRLLKSARGYFGARSKHFRRAHEAVLHAGAYAFSGRRDRKVQYRRLWIQRINAGLKPFEIKYSGFINLLKTKKMKLDRKVLAALAVSYPDIFRQLIATLKE